MMDERINQQKKEFDIQLINKNNQIKGILII